MNFRFWKRKKPAYITFGGQRIMDLFDDERIKVVIKQEPGFAEQKKKAILRKLDVEVGDEEECMEFVENPSDCLGLNGTLRGSVIHVKCLPGRYYLSIDGVEIEDGVPNKEKVVGFIYGVRDALHKERDSVKNLELAVQAAKNARIKEEKEQKKKDESREMVQAFFNRR